MDRISYLPDELLCHILSFLPTNIAFTTTVLSKQWTPLFHSLDFLDLVFKGYETSFNRFCHFVDSLTLSTNKPLKKFHLDCYYGCKQDCNIFNTWLEALIRRRVQQIHLNLHNHTLNLNIFISETLIVLKLKNLKITSDASCVHLPSLKTLHLDYLSFQKSNDYHNFLCACPNLEDLFIHEITLRHIDQDSYKDIPGFKFQNLIRFKLDYSCETQSIYCWWYSVVDMLRLCPKLQFFFIKKWRNTRSPEEWKWPISVVECVSSHLTTCTILNFDGSANDLCFATYILQNARLLQDMKIGVTTNGMLLEKSDQIVKKLSSCPRISLVCKLTFEFKNIY